jgi:hypothetical protein
VSSTSDGQRSSSAGVVPLKKLRLRPFMLTGNMFSTATVIPVSSRMRGIASSSQAAYWVCQRYGGWITTVDTLAVSAKRTQRSSLPLGSVPKTSQVATRNGPWTAGTGTP